MLHDITVFYLLFIIVFLAQGVSGSRVVCCGWLCNLLHRAGQKHPLTSPSGNLQNMFLPDLSYIINTGSIFILYHKHWKYHNMLGSEKNTFSQSNTRSLGCQTFVKVFVNLSICLRYKYFTGWDLAVTIRKHLRQQKSEKKHLSNHRQLHIMMILYHISLTFVWFMNFYVFFHAKYARGAVWLPQSRWHRFCDWPAA